MRILLLTDAFPPEVRSSSHLMYELAEDLQRRGHQVTVVTCQPRYNLAPHRSAAEGRKERAQQQSRLGAGRVNGVQVIRVTAPAIHNVSHWRRASQWAARPSGSGGE